MVAASEDWLGTRAETRIQSRGITMRSLACNVFPALIRFYGFALACAAAAFGATLLLRPVLNGHSPLLLFALAVAASTLFGGFGPGIFCTMVSAGASVNCIQTPESIQATMQSQFVGEFQIAIFLVVGVILSWMGREVRNSRLGAVALASERNRILESIPDGFIVIGKNWRVTYFSKAAGELIRTPTRELIGQVLWNVVSQWRGTTVESKLREALGRAAPVRFDYWSEKANSWLLFHVQPQLDGGLTVYFTDITERKTAEDQLRQALTDRDAALRKVHVLSGLLPICANCKKIRDQEGLWHQMEQYVTEHSDAQFSHTICPDCGRRYYGDLT